MNVVGSEIDKIDRHRKAMVKILQTCASAPEHYSRLQAVLKEFRIGYGLLIVMVEFGYVKKVSKGHYISILPASRVEPINARNAIERIRERWPKLRKQSEKVNVEQSEGQMNVVVRRALIYNKKGRWGEEAMFLVDGLQDVYMKMITEDKTLIGSIKQCTTLDELKRQHDIFCPGRVYVKQSPVTNPITDMGTDFIKGSASAQKEITQPMSNPVNAEDDEREKKVAEIWKDKTVIRMHEPVSKTRAEKEKREKKEFSFFWGLISFKW